MAAPAEAAGLTVNTADDLAWSAGACPASKVATSAATDAAMAKSRHHRRRPPPPPPPPAKKCSLRAAIVQANMDGVRDVITVPAMTIILGFAKGSAEPTTIDPDGCFDLDLTASMAIVGAGSGQTIVDANRSCRVMQIGDGKVSPIVNITGMTMTHGRSSTQAGGVLVWQNASLSLSDVFVTSNQSRQAGGGISNHGDLSLYRSWVDGNNANPGDFTGGGVVQQAGGIYSSGNLTVDSSAITNNVALRAGGISNVGGNADIVNTTISGNKVLNQGGGIRNVSTVNCDGSTSLGVMNIAFSTITNNEAGGSDVPDWNGTLHAGGSDPAPEAQHGGGIFNSASSSFASPPGCGGPPTLTDPAGIINMGATILAGNLDPAYFVSSRDFTPDCYSPDAFALTSFRSNLVGLIGPLCDFEDTDNGRNPDGTTCCDLLSQDPNNPVNPVIVDLELNAPGTTPTHEVTPESAAYDGVTFGTSAPFLNCPATDQRGVSRPDNGDGQGCDIGAYEANS